MRKTSNLKLSICCVVYVLLIRNLCTGISTTPAPKFGNCHNRGQANCYLRSGDAPYGVDKSSYFENVCGGWCFDDALCVEPKEKCPSGDTPMTLFGDSIGCLALTNAECTAITSSPNGDTFCRGWCDWAFGLSGCASTNSELCVADIGDKLRTQVVDIPCNERQDCFSCYIQDSETPNPVCQWCPTDRSCRDTVKDQTCSDGLADEFACPRQYDPLTTKAPVVV